MSSSTHCVVCQFEHHAPVREEDAQVGTSDRREATVAFLLINGNTTPSSGIVDRFHPPFWERERGDLDRHRPQTRSGPKAFAALGLLACCRCCCDGPRPTGGEPLTKWPLLLNGTTAWFVL